VAFPQGKYFYKWALTDNKAKEFISLIEPYLVEKKLQAQAIANFPTFARGKRPSLAERIMRDAIYNRVKELNQA